MWSTDLDSSERGILLATASASIGHGVDHNRPLEVDTRQYPARLRAVQSCFVTLLKYGELRGCIGSLTATRALIEDVAANAFAAAFKDPRFPAVRPDERGSLTTQISLLSPQAKMRFDSDEDLLRQLVPGTDGLILAHRGRQATFLPSVWASLPEPRQFLAQLRLKADIPDSVATTDLDVWRYHAQKIDCSPDPATG